MCLPRSITNVCPPRLRFGGGRGYRALALWLGLMGTLWSAAASAASPDSTTRPSGYEKARIIPIRNEITEITRDAVDRRVQELRRENVGLVIFELDTPGGALGPTLDICSAIKRMRDQGVRTVAWVNAKAYSAGTIIALATGEIVMAPHATMGDCQPIMITEMGASAVPEELEAKVVSPLLSELRDSARRGGYDLEMIYALIRPDMQMFWVVDGDSGEKRFVDAAGRDRLFGIDTGVDAAESEADDSEDSSRKKSKPARQEPVLDTLSTTSWKYVYEVEGLGKVVQPVVSRRELLTMHTDEALAYGFAVGAVANQSDLATRYNIAGDIVTMHWSWMESSVEWLTSPVVRSVLLILVLLGAYAEFHTPGFGLAGGVAAVALLLYFVPPYIAGTTVTWEIAAAVVGLALLAVEIFLIPGFGVAGITGLILLGIAVVTSYVPEEPGWRGWPHWPTMPMTYTYLYRGLGSMAVALSGSLVGMILLARLLPKMPMVGRIIAPNPTREQITMDDPYDGAASLGDIGLSESLLRPAGKARFGATLVDVVSEGEYIPRGTRVEVVERHGNRVVVRAMGK